jgi:hypothetical protein
MINYLMAQSHSENLSVGVKSIYTVLNVARLMYSLGKLTSFPLTCTPISWLTRKSSIHMIHILFPTFRPKRVNGCRLAVR